MVEKCYYIGLYIGLGPDANRRDSALQNIKPKERLTEQRGRKAYFKRVLYEASVMGSGPWQAPTLYSTHSKAVFNRLFRLCCPGLCPVQF